jgi:hypothetical protein
MAIDEEKKKSVELAITQIEKQHGRGSIMKMGQEGAVIPLPWIQPLVWVVCPGAGL